MTRTETIIAVKDVPKSSKWYQSRPLNYGFPIQEKIHLKL